MILKNLIFESGSLQIIMSAFTEIPDAREFVLNNSQIDGLAALAVVAAVSERQKRIIFNLGIVDLRLNRVLLRNFDLDWIGISPQEADPSVIHPVHEILLWLYMEYFHVKWLLYDISMEEETYNFMVDYIVKNEFSEELKAKLTAEYRKAIEVIRLAHEKLNLLTRAAPMPSIIEFPFNEVAESAIMRSIIASEGPAVSVLSVVESPSDVPMVSIPEPIYIPSAPPMTPQLEESSPELPLIPLELGGTVTEGEFHESLRLERLFEERKRQSLQFIVTHGFIWQMLSGFASYGCTIL